MDERGRKADFRFGETAFISEASGNHLEKGLRIFLKRHPLSSWNGGTFPGFPPEVEGQANIKIVMRGRNSNA